jgi:cytochrome c-type biogenesis protein CcmE
MNSNGAFVADEVLAKHDEKYMPPEVAASLKNKGSRPPSGGGPAVNGASGGGPTS